MKQQLEQRLTSLKTEFESGQTMLTELEAKKANLTETLLRISGAIQVLEEMLVQSQTLEENGNQNLESDVTSILTNS
ncbi:MAG: hypothetical protein F6K50_19515 [Moorea sp. SIO3I7]|uniref:hypothetical protein n=1 Tax=unclassified Moorena TaxID=2683338 RepID=UPI0013C299DD|nr:MULTISPECIES: hypothetical protein [unclassified Moorena]NEN97633.1 hypothetical protein [Moorena sp. SIO3I7]NEO08109.1 hypothetical protein [Moorena sp. SIO3I8]NEP23526.1 hypothetical protein [Moorena sp. SIO3I6]